MNQRKKPKQGYFESLGVFAFDAGKKGTVVIQAKGTDGYVIVNAVQLLRQKQARPKR